MGGAGRWCGFVQGIWTPGDIVPLRKSEEGNVNYVYSFGDRCEEGGLPGSKVTHDSPNPSYLKRGMIWRGNCVGAWAL